MDGRLWSRRIRHYPRTAGDFRSAIRVSELKRRIAVISALGVFACSAYLLATASPWLLVEPVRSWGLPLGTLVAWAGIVSLPLASFLGFHRLLNRKTRPARVARASMIGLLLLCAAWGFVAYGLAGNWAFNFSNQSGSFRGSVAAGEIFWAYSKSIVGLAVLAPAALFLLAVLLKW